jgi:hypothetical protein
MRLEGISTFLPVDKDIWLFDGRTAPARRIAKMYDLIYDVVI